MGSFPQGQEAKASAGNVVIGTADDGDRFIEWALRKHPRVTESELRHIAKGKPDTELYLEFLAESANERNLRADSKDLHILNVQDYGNSYHDDSVNAWDPLLGNVVKIKQRLGLTTDDLKNAVLSKKLRQELVELRARPIRTRQELVDRLRQEAALRQRERDISRLIPKHRLPANNPVAQMLEASIAAVGADHAIDGGPRYQKFIDAMRRRAGILEAEYAVEQARKDEELSKAIGEPLDSAIRRRMIDKDAEIAELEGLARQTESLGESLVGGAMRPQLMQYFVTHDEDKKKSDKAKAEFNRAGQLRARMLKESRDAERQAKSRRVQLLSADVMVPYRPVFDAAEDTTIQLLGPLPGAPLRRGLQADPDFDAMPSLVRQHAPTAASVALRQLRYIALDQNPIFGAEQQGSSAGAAGAPRD
jgi:hypothetical protein